MEIIDIVPGGTSDFSARKMTLPCPCTMVLSVVQQFFHGCYHVVEIAVEHGWHRHHGVGCEEGAVVVDKNADHVGAMAEQLHHAQCLAADIDVECAVVDD